MNFEELLKIAKKSSKEIILNNKSSYGKVAVACITSKNNIYSLYEVYYELIFHYQNTKETEKLNKIIYFERKSDNLENKIIKKINKIR